MSRFVIAGLCAYSASANTVTFDAFVEKHGRSYKQGTEEYDHRLTLFKQRESEVAAHNVKPDRRWTAGLNKLADWTETELVQLRGWDGSVRPDHSGTRVATVHKAFLQASSEDSELPDEKSWADLETAHEIKNQGSCGSCWAISSATVLEAHTEIHGKRKRFSPQQIVSCTPNPRACGGTGMCEGATAELAMDWVLKNGCADESEVPYEGVDGSCTNQNPVLAMNQLLGGSSSLVQNGGAAFGMTGWERLPQNEQEPLMRALVERGPVAISVGANDWQSYESGVFDGCDKDAIIDHAVTLIAYGKDESNKFWTIQNSWGSDWGEGGHIRLLRQDDTQSYCGMDNKPQEGTACKGENDPVKVCGMCGMLFDSVVPHF